jgi:hypothetical protein
MGASGFILNEILFSEISHKLSVNNRITHSAHYKFVQTELTRILELVKFYRFKWSHLILALMHRRAQRIF